MPYLNGFEESLNNQGAIRKHIVKIQTSVALIFLKLFSFLLIKKVQLFKVPFRGTWLRRKS
jgi:hypothetical protein